VTHAFFTLVSREIYNLLGSEIEPKGFSMWLCVFALVLGCALTVTAAGPTPVEIDPTQPGEAKRDAAGPTEGRNISA
jgi:hypothetical protein